jgi:hypothetical protein
MIFGAHQGCDCEPTGKHPLTALPIDLISRAPSFRASRPCLGPFEAFDSAVGHGRSEHAAQTTKVALGR